MELDSKIEEKLKINVLRYLEGGRPGWDVPHTLACVYWMKELLKYEAGNARILIPAIYFHDIGYIELMEENRNLDLKKNMDMKEEHMKRGAIIARKILDEVGSFTEEEIERIAYLVSIHDSFEKIAESDDIEAQLVYEADGLGQIDRERVKPTYSKEDAKIFLRDFQNKRGLRFKTESGKKFYKELIEKAIEYSNSL